tara:strand:+ start:848 stop:3496 length:2649 start_codon:yes stop_codon:yes gene_type:complete
LLFQKKKTKKFLVFLITVFTLTLFYLLSITPGLKGDLEQSLRILLKQPVLLKSKAIKENKVLDYSSKIFYAIENRLFNQTQFDNLKIDIKFSELEKIKLDRKKALRLNKLNEPHKVNIVISHQGKKYNATARLKGDLSGHWGNIKQWSLRIKLKKNKTIFKMNEFSISIFAERDFPYNFVISETLREYDVLVPRYRTVNVNFNGSDWGLMLVEEQFHESFYAYNKIKEAPIFKMTNENNFFLSPGSQDIENIKDIIRWQGKLETEIYNENEILKKTNIPNKDTNGTLISIFKNLQEIIVLKDKNYLGQINKYIDVNSFARVAAITAIFGDTHSVSPPNARYYLNPYDLKIKPIITDSGHSSINKNFFMNHNFFYKNIFQLKEFQDEYLKTLINIKNNFLNIKSKFSSACKNFGKNCENLVEIEMIKKNINFLIYQKNKIFEDKIILIEKKLQKNKFNTINIENLNKKKVNLRAFDNGELFVDNLTSENLLIENIKLISTKKCISNCKKISRDINLLLKPSTFENLTTKKIKFNFDQSLNSFLEINYFDEKEIRYSEVARIEKNNLKKKVFFKANNSNSDKIFIKIKKNYILKKGTYIINKPLIVPSGFNLVMENGVELKMTPNTYIMVVDGLVKFNGTAINPINITSLDEEFKWKGIYVNSNSVKDDFSVLNNVNISNYTYFDNEKIQLTGGINFINSKINIFNSNISGSFAEDAINLVNTDFKVFNTIVQNSISDGIDVDFGNGEITNSKFNNIEGDAIDLSGSFVNIENVSINNIGDKAISAGEETTAKINRLYISSSRIGIASKDSSIVTGSNVEILDCGLFDFTAYQKKSYFTGAFLKIDTISNCNKSLVQHGSKLIINNKIIAKEKLNIKNLYEDTL